MRECGILMPIFSLSDKYGIGCFSKEAYTFVDRLRAANQKYWQILPLGPTSYGDSPYQSFSAYAGNPYFIDLEDLIQLGLLEKEECEGCLSSTGDSYIDYEALYQNRFVVLKKAFQRFDCRNSDFLEFRQQESAWLEDYSLFMALKDDYQGKSWIHWEKSIQTRQEEAINLCKQKFAKEIEFYCFLQYIFQKQWLRLKKYANGNGIRIIGDVPIYVAFDSADSWANKELFQFDEDGYPIGVAGCPPDAFSSTGQLWGNPLYNWEYHKKTNYAWWIQRVAYSFRLFDKVRVDHFRGFDEYYSIPYGQPTAEHGSWEKGPGYELFECLFQKLGKLDIIAEDLGFLTPSVIELVKRTGFPGMKILQFAFYAWEDNSYLPHNYEKNCVVYPGTHDNDTLLGWYQKLGKDDQEFVDSYSGNRNGQSKELVWNMIRLAMGSAANLCIIPIQDYLVAGSEARINTPSTLGHNWEWRVNLENLTLPLCDEINKLTKTFFR